MTATYTHSKIPAPLAPEPTPGQPPPIGDPPPDGPHVPCDPRDLRGVHEASDPLAESARQPRPRDLGGPEDAIAAPVRGAANPSR